MSQTALISSVDVQVILDMAEPMPPTPTKPTRTVSMGLVLNWERASPARASVGAARAKPARASDAGGRARLQEFAAGGIFRIVAHGASRSWYGRLYPIRGRVYGVEALRLSFQSGRHLARSA